MREKLQEAELKIAFYFYFLAPQILVRQRDEHNHKSRGNGKYFFI